MERLELPQVVRAHFEKTIDKCNAESTSVILQETFFEPNHAAICTNAYCNETFLDRTTLEGLKMAGVDHIVEDQKIPLTFNLAGNPQMENLPR